MSRLGTISHVTVNREQVSEIMVHVEETSKVLFRYMYILWGSLKI